MKHGVIVVDKPEGISSAKVVACVKKLLGAGKAGHTGTLDPFATGVMLCGINQGTRISRFLLGGPKTYQAEIRLGIVTDTLDRTGKVDYESDPEGVLSLSPQTIRETVGQFCGRLRQVPPVYSALKHNGQPLYKLARQGRQVTKPPRDVEIYSLEILNIDLPFLSTNVHCSAGTYIRSLARDIGDALGCGGHLSSLRRTESCGTGIDQAVKLSELMEMDQAEAWKRVLPMAGMLKDMPEVTAGPALCRHLAFGRAISVADLDIDPGSLETGFLKVMDVEGELAAILEVDKSGQSYNYCCVFID